MGLRDAAGIADIVRGGDDVGRRSGAPQVLDALRLGSARRHRQPDFYYRYGESFVAERFLPMQLLRAAGLHLIGSIGPFRRVAMREGLAPSWLQTRRVS